MYCDYCGYQFDFLDLPVYRYGYVVHENCWASIHQEMILGYYFHGSASYYFT